MGSLVKPKALKPSDSIKAILFDEKVVEKISNSQTGTLVVCQDGATFILTDKDEVITKD